MVAGIVDEDMRSEVDDDTVSYPCGGNGDRACAYRLTGGRKKRGADALQLGAIMEFVTIYHV